MRDVELRSESPAGSMVTTPRPPAISVVIPAYNPQERIFSRVLTAVAGLCTNDAGIDCVIVDNNSTPPLD